VSLEPEQISAEEAIALASGESVLLDVREQYEWDAVHAPGATHLAMSTMQSGPVELAEDANYLVICASGARSQTVASALTAAGYAAANVIGGMAAWEQAGGPVERPAAPRPLN
jgi:rhodanese-related sulfurtransferase